MEIFLTHTPSSLATHFGERAYAALEALAPVRLNPTGEVLGGAELAAAAQGCAFVIADRQTPADAQFFAASPKLLALLRCAVDIRTIDVAAASEHGVLVTRSTPSFGPSVAELALGFIIDLARGVTDAAAAYRAGGNPAPGLGRQLAGSTIGIIGFGVIGRHLAAVARTLGMKVLVTDPYTRIDEIDIIQVPLEALLAESEFIVCLAPATPETENMFSSPQFAAMRNDAFFVNLARGELVDEAALEMALEAGEIAGAAMDVGRAPGQMPSPRLARRSDVIATPHIGGQTPAATEGQAFYTVEQVKALLAGEIPVGAINASAATRLESMRPGDGGRRTRPAE